MQFFSFFLSLGLLLTVIISNGLDSPEPRLRESADFPVGVAINPKRLAQTDYAQVVGREFSSITAENVMKPQYIWAAERQYDFSLGDSLLEFAQAHNQQVHGHTLAWHLMQPDWLENTIDSYDSATLENLLRDYIQATVKHYRGKVVSWDVVNEAVSSGGKGWRNSVYHQKLGDDYVARCHQYAREADPDVLLFYNDYDVIASSEKLATILAMVDDFQSRNIPIDGIGLQMHIRLDFSLDKFQYALDEIVKRNLKVHLSEVDIRTNPDGELSTLTEEAAQQQQELLAAIVQRYQQLPAENKFAITFWGLRDNESWLTKHTGHPQWPLLFNENFSKKPMYQGFLDGLDANQTQLD
ncbi:endo-1,4-beta-xylanase [Tunicatimonas pelagia]|uniref:endo-1,4-beta-xylanase n=1 Tax=Tunicatimonas pelagia TaxID=931531 RepID=UPI0026653376|nr:endo-1,4-beta-xylanase [Tunicatimonas pelagia]WKN42648.1 endo-1,4-beta-xylanase [Tunicatimonas pelagia]